jgi:hypothetical protein
MTQDPDPICASCIHHAPEPFDMAPEDAFCLLLHRRTLDSETCEKHEAEGE